jgi:hypothetical protein
MKDHLIAQLPSPAEIAAALAEPDDQPEPEAADAPRDESVQPPH